MQNPLRISAAVFLFYLFFIQAAGRLAAEDPGFLSESEHSSKISGNSGEKASLLKNKTERFLSERSSKGGRFEYLKLQIHKVGLNIYHASLLIVPENPEHWKNLRDKKGNLIFKSRNDRHGNPMYESRIFATFGGQRKSGRLVSSFNRNTDIYDPKIKIIKIDTENISEDKLIPSVLELANSYNDRLEYGPFPEKGRSFWIFGRGYNSNSLISGILVTLGLKLPEVGLNLPGFGKPAPLYSETEFPDICEEIY